MARPLYVLADGEIDWMIIRLQADYRGVLTDEQYYLAGLYADGDMPGKHMQALVSAGRALVVTPEPTSEGPAEAPAPRVVTRKRSRAPRAKK